MLEARTRTTAASADAAGGGASTTIKRPGESGVVTTARIFSPFTV
jgi:hypothetical protein